MQTSAQANQLLNLLTLLQTKQTLETLSEDLRTYKEFCYNLYLCALATQDDRPFIGHEQIKEIPRLIHSEALTNDNSLSFLVPNARVYDSAIGRFLSADTIVQAPHDSQSYNRYSYVRNNPLVFTDPTGHSWLSKLWKKAKKYVRTIVAVMVAVVIAVYAPYLLAHYGGVAFGATVAGSTTLTFAGTVAVGALAGFASGAIITGSFKGAMQGALWGGLSAGLLYGVSSGTESLFKADIKLSVTKLMKAGMHKAAAFKSIANGLSRGLIAKLQGGSFKRSFLMSAGSFALKALYTKVVGYDATWKSGGDAVDKEVLTKPQFGHNNIGIAGKVDSTSWFGEGGYVSRTLNKVPGVNAVAGMHDMMQIGFDNLEGVEDGILRTIGNVPAMLPAAVLVYGALASDYTYVIEQGSRERRR